ncbi:MAG: hypothetical protein A4E65_02383 [Syntrophorhabdus sp. PtaU1.Bin153]|nr:MAG: hypothetical protein A4E65_02383 [Syntrophorhabdus sp. PtaU1.Bin153]
MLKNINYDIMESITILSKSLYRYDAYIKDAAGCESCQKLWSEFRKQREKELSMLLLELKKHIESEVVSFEPEFPEVI